MTANSSDKGVDPNFDKLTKSLAYTEPLSANLMAEIISDRMKTCPLPVRPQAPHYVGQMEYDAETGMLDMFSGKISKGEAALQSSVNDLSKESKLIKGAETGGNDALADIKNGDSKGAKTELTDTIKDLKGNWYNNADRNDYRNALNALGHGETKLAETDISQAETALNSRETRVQGASSDLSAAEKAFKTNFNDGEKDVLKATEEIQSPQHVVPLDKVHAN